MAGAGLAAAVLAEGGLEAAGCMLHGNGQVFAALRKSFESWTNG
jgi:hypothetical protein